MTAAGDSLVAAAFDFIAVDIWARKSLTSWRRVCRGGADLRRGGDDDGGGGVSEPATTDTSSMALVTSPVAWVTVCTRATMSRVAALLFHRGGDGGGDGIHLGDRFADLADGGHGGSGGQLQDGHNSRAPMSWVALAICVASAFALTGDDESPCRHRRRRPLRWWRSEPAD